MTLLLRCRCVWSDIATSCVNELVKFWDNFFDGFSADVAKKYRVCNTFNGTLSRGYADRAYQLKADKFVRGDREHRMIVNSHY